ncbi:endonuclease toxin domain-containing protein [Streptomyces albogriseolus]
MRTPSALTWICTDHNGTASLQIAASGQALVRRHSQPFGEPRDTKPATWQGEKGFVGGTEDPTGLTHLGARDYDTATGRFVSVDPIGDLKDPQQINGYAYSNNNPVTFSDPDGKWLGALIALVFAVIKIVTALLNRPTGGGGGGGGMSPMGSGNYGNGGGGGSSSPCGAGYPAMRPECASNEPLDPRPQGSFKDLGLGFVNGIVGGLADTLDLGVKLHPSCWAFGDSCSPTRDAWDGFSKKQGIDKNNKANDAGEAAALVGGFVLGIGSAVKSLTRLLKGAADEAASSPWSLPANERGFAIEDDVFGGSNLPNNFKTIDYWDASTGTAVSYKSFDTNAKTYANGSKGVSALKSKAKTYARQMATYNGGTTSGVTVPGGAAIKNRGLKIAVPMNISAAQMAALEDVVAYGAGKGVRVEVVKVE